MIRWALASLVLCACGGICPNDADIVRPATAGSYVPATPPLECTGAPLAPITTAATAQLTISADRSTVTEEYVREGKTYRVVYDVTAIETPP
jgi:hypothetical protein